MQYITTHQYSMTITEAHMHTNPTQRQRQPSASWKWFKFSLYMLLVAPFVCFILQEFLLGVNYLYPENQIDLYGIKNLKELASLLSRKTLVITTIFTGLPMMGAIWYLLFGKPRAGENTEIETTISEGSEFLLDKGAVTEVKSEKDQSPLTLTELRIKFYRKLLAGLASIIENSTYTHIFLSFCIVLAGLVFIFLSSQIDNEIIHSVCKEIGIAFIPIGLISFIYEAILRRDFLHNMKSAIVEEMPSRYTNMRKAGIVDAYPDLQMDKLKESIESLENCEIKIIDIWMENLNRIENALYDAVTARNCTVRILVFDPRVRKALESRGRGIHMDYPSIAHKIMDNLEYVHKVRNKVLAYFRNKADYVGNESMYDCKFEVKIYDGFIGLSLIGYGSECLIGFYLRGRLSTMGTQLKVTSEKRFFFNELMLHFHKQWNDTEQSRALTDDLYSDLQAYIKNIFCKDDNPNNDNIDVSTNDESTAPITES